MLRYCYQAALTRWWIKGSWLGDAMTPVISRWAGASDALGSVYSRRP